MRLIIFCNPEKILHEKRIGISETAKILSFGFLEDVLNTQPWYSAIIESNRAE
jgi:hypothetical protein